MLWFIIYIASLITSLVSAANAEEGVASQYGRDSGNRVACGGELDEGALTAAHRTLPCGTRVRVTNESNGQSVTVTVNDRGPFVDGRVIDLTPAAANAIRMGGLARVTLSLSQSGTYWSATTRDIVPAMPSPSRIRVPAKAKPSTAKPRQWRASLIRKRGQILGYVEARDRAAAEIAAAAEFNLTDEQRKRLVVQERG